MKKVEIVEVFDEDGNLLEFTCSACHERRDGDSKFRIEGDTGGGICGACFMERWWSKLVVA